MINKKLLISVVILLGLIFMIVVLLQGSVINAKGYNIEEQQLEYPKDANIVEEELVLTNDLESFLINRNKVDDEIRVPVNTLLHVNVINNTQYDTSIHFHGIRGLSKMDGVGGMTQDNISPDSSFTYEFYLDDPGTYMYHSHVDSNNQVNNEFLFGGLVVEGEEQESFTNKQSLIFNTNDESSVVTTNGENELGYQVKDNGDIYLNLVNLSSSPIYVYFGDDIEYQIVNVDANDVKSEKIIGKELYIPTANRVEIIIRNPKHSFQIQTTQDGMENSFININFKGQENINNQNLEEKTYEKQQYYSNRDSVYLYDVIEMEQALGLKDEKVDKSYDMTLNMEMMKWVINGKAYPETEPLIVEEGDVVEVNLKSPSAHHSAPHPFHLHGHEFEVTKVNGEELAKPLVLDTIEVLPEKEYTVRFKADNPGLWAFHCHDLQHATTGMMTSVQYNGYYFSTESKVSE